MRRTFFIVAFCVVMLALASVIRIKVIYNGKQVVDIGNGRKSRPRQAASLERLFGLEFQADHIVGQAIFDAVTDACRRADADAVMVSADGGGYLVMAPPDGTARDAAVTIKKYDERFQPDGEADIALADGREKSPAGADAVFVWLRSGIGIYDRYRRQMNYFDSELNYLGRDEEFSYYNIIGFYRSEKGYTGRVYPDYSGHLVFKEPAGRGDSVRMIKSDFTGDWQDVKCMNALETGTHVLLRTEKDFIVFEKSSGDLRKYHLFDEGYYHALLFDGRYIYLTPATGTKSALIFDAKKQTKKSIGEKRFLLQLDNGAVLEPYAKNGEYHLAEYKLAR